MIYFSIYHGFGFLHKIFWRLVRSSYLSPESIFKFHLIKPPSLELNIDWLLMKTSYSVINEACQGSFVICVANPKHF